MLHAQALHEIAVKDLDGRSATLVPFKGRVLLVVNVASECGYTGQYAGLQALHEKYAAQGLAVLGFPCNQFGGQEPGTNAEIKRFCTANYRVTFPMFAKIEVNGANRHPLFARLLGKDSPAPGDVKWNFEKFLVGRDGRLLRRFDAGTEPDDPVLVSAIEAALAPR
ncbi:MAG: glutathione peroxidase [Opitutaceae bacterium]|nr:glutathione peroxidase [Opitutaceae bacterium]